jgi:acid stress-induced BolA-like protein IbaG/YrbA
MNSEQLTEILKAAFPEAEVAVSGQGGKFDLRIVDDQFEGKRPVARQQAATSASGKAAFKISVSCSLFITKTSYRTNGVKTCHFTINLKNKS